MPQKELIKFQLDYFAKTHLHTSRAVFVNKQKTDCRRLYLYNDKNIRVDETNNIVIFIVKATFTELEQSMQYH